MDISASKQQSILSALSVLEREQGIDVLLACESGSRAWGFASPDSDYDVRFIYRHEKNWYLTLCPEKDNIDLMLPGELDLSGWDIRKTLQLYAKSNIGLFEWLGSPMVYRADAAFLLSMQQQIAHFFSPIKGFNHYLSQAKKTYHNFLLAEQVGIKKVFYWLRPMMACAWIQHQKTMPPTAFQALIEGDWVTPQEKNWIQAWLMEKQTADEGALFAIPAEQRLWMTRLLAQFSEISQDFPANNPANADWPDRFFLDQLSVDSMRRQD